MIEGEGGTVLDVKSPSIAGKRLIIIISKAIVGGNREAVENEVGLARGSHHVEGVFTIISAGEIILIKITGEDGGSVRRIAFRVQQFIASKSSVNGDVVGEHESRVSIVVGLFLSFVWKVSAFRNPDFKSIHLRSDGEGVLEMGEGIRPAGAIIIARCIRIDQESAHHGDEIRF